jgi:anti-sigma B factor antagonist
MGEREDGDTTVCQAGITFDTDGIVIMLSGEIDLSNVESLREKIEPVVSKRVQQVVFDLRELSFMDSSGIALLLQLAAQSQSVRIRKPSALVRKMIEATGLSEVLPIEP